LLPLFDVIKRLRVAVVGETIRDTFVAVRPLSTPPEYGHVVVETVAQEEFFGGVLPVARDLASFVSSTCLVTNDVGEISSRWSNPRLSIKGAEHAPIRKTRYVSQEETLFFQCAWPRSSEWALGQPAFRQEALSAARSADLVVVIDYGHGLITPELATELSETARFLAVNCQANGGAYPFHQAWKYPSFHLLMLNEFEARLNCGMPQALTQSALAQCLLDRSRARYCIVTDASRGAWICSENQVTHQRSLCTSIADTIGCGDTMLGFCALAAAAERDPADILYLGSVAAAAKAMTQVHAGQITPQELLDVETSIV
jgi:bifunctional ADP-heptose synthase (sugar kinase/adenylyltransferase)